MECGHNVDQLIVPSFSGEWRWLSNFWPCNVELDGIIYPSSEHAFVAHKSIHEPVRRQVAEIPSPGMAKKFGRSIALRKDWERIKLVVMARIIAAKFDQNSDLHEKLMATKGMFLIEGNTWGDHFWGVCNGKGHNHLGKILMAYRDDPF